MSGNEDPTNPRVPSELRDQTQISQRSHKFVVMQRRSGELGTQPSPSDRAPALAKVWALVYPKTSVLLAAIGTAILYRIDEPLILGF